MLKSSADPLQHLWHLLQAQPFLSSVMMEPDKTPIAQFPIELQPMTQQMNLREPQDDWTGKTNTAERKRLQNRIHQREYRRKQRRTVSRGGRHDNGPSISAAQTYSEAATQVLSNPENDRLVQVCQQIRVSRTCRLGTPETWNRLHRFISEACAEYAAGTPRLNHLPILMGINVVNALAENAKILGLSKLWLDYHAVSPFCQQVVDARHTTVSPEIVSHFPSNLCPTTTQNTVEHHPWIDLFPLPVFRDNILRAIASTIDSFDEDEFCYDLVDVDNDKEAGQAALVVWGSQPWDVRNWEVTETFLRKWGWLLRGCKELIEATNYWRAARGESRIRL